MSTSVRQHAEHGFSYSTVGGGSKVSHTEFGVYLIVLLFIDQYCAGDQ